MKCVKLYSDNDKFIVPSSSHYGSWFVVFTKDYCTIQDNRVSAYDGAEYGGKHKNWCC